MDKITEGMKVTPDPTSDRIPDDVRGRVFTAYKVNPKNVRCSADDGGRGINYPKALLVEATDENVAAGKLPMTRPYEPPEHYVVGEIVTLKTAYKDWTTETPLVVIGGQNRVNVTLLGGADDQYLRAPRTGLVRRDLSWLREHLTSA